jgi:hypothetical protein
MNESKYSIIELYGEKNDDYIAVGPDPDGLDMVELKYVPIIGHKIDFYMPRGQAVLVALSIIELYGEKNDSKL